MRGRVQPVLENNRLAGNTFTTTPFTQQKRENKDKKKKIGKAYEKVLIIRRCDDSSHARDQHNELRESPSLVDAPSSTCNLTGGPAGRH